MSPCNINPWYNSSFSGEASPSHASTSHQMSPLRKMMKKFRYNNIRTWSISPHAIPFLYIQTTWTIVQNNTTKLFFDLPSAIFYFLLLLIPGTTKKKSIATAGSAEQIRRKLLMYVTQKKEIGLMDSPDMSIHNRTHGTPSKKEEKNSGKKRRKEPTRVFPLKYIMYEIIEFLFMGSGAFIRVFRETRRIFLCKHTQRLPVVRDCVCPAHTHRQTTGNQ